MLWTFNLYIANIQVTRLRRPTALRKISTTASICMSVKIRWLKQEGAPSQPESERRHIQESPLDLVKDWALTSSLISSAKPVTTKLSWWVWLTKYCLGKPQISSLSSHCINIITYYRTFFLTVLLRLITLFNNKIQILFL